MQALLQECKRKAFHMLALVFPLVYAFTTQENMLKIIVPLTALALFIDAQRRRETSLSAWIQATFGGLMRPHEKSGRLSGLSYLFLGVTITVVLYGKIVAITALLILVLADSASAICGKLFGRRRCFGLENKSWEGVGAFTLTSWLVIISVNLATGAFPSALVMGLFVGFLVALVEVAAGRFRLDDNLLIPLSAGMMLTPFYVRLVG